MAYPAGYWAEVRISSSLSSIVEAADGSRIWLVTSDGEPLEQQVFVSGSWRDINLDTEEPDYLTTRTDPRPFRFRKTGENWLPSNNGLIIRNINWGGGSRYRFFEVPNNVSKINLGASALSRIYLGTTEIQRVYQGTTEIWRR